MAEGFAGTAERILLGNIVMLDAAGSVAEAIAIGGGRILQVGRRGEVLERRGDATAIEDFGGATIIPGFNDTHAHLDAQGLKTLRPSLAGLHSIDQILARIADLARTTPPGRWIVTMPVGEPPYYFDAPGQLAERRLPTRHELDRAAPDHPVYLCSPSGFWGQPPCYSVLNSPALKLNGIDRTTRPRAAGIEIVTDDAGDPTGVIVEHNYVNLVELDLLPAVPKFSLADRVEGVRRSLPLYASHGTTSIYEGHGCAPEVIAAFRQLWDEDALTLRAGLVVSPAWFGTEQAARALRDWLPLMRGRGFGDAMLRVSGIFVAYGGDPIISALVQANPADIGWGGGIKQVNDAATFEEICMLAGKQDVRVHTVASDKLHELVPILERVAEHYPIGERRWVVEHISRATAEDLRRLRRLGVAVTLIPAHYLWKVGLRFAALGQDELALLSPARALYELGAPVSAGTDAVPNDPLFSLWAMTARQERTTGRVMGEAGAVSNEVGLRLLTVAGAWLTFEERVKGPLLPGYYADLAVLSDDPRSARGDELFKIRCEVTMVDGKWVYGRP